MGQGTMPAGGMGGSSGSQPMMPAGGMGMTQPGPMMPAGGFGMTQPGPMQGAAPPMPAYGNFGGPSAGVMPSGGAANTFGAVGNPQGMMQQPMGANPQMQAMIQPLQQRLMNPQMMRALGLG